MNPHAEPIPEKFRHYDNMPWFARSNDLIGGWCIMTADKPPSQCNFREGEIEVGCFMTEQTARRIASAHNAELLKSMKGWPVGNWTEGNLPMRLALILAEAYGEEADHMRQALADILNAYDEERLAAMRTPSAADEAFGTPWELLAQWYDWWRNTDEAPAKMPDALHVRTAMALMMHEVDGTSSAEERAAAFDRMQDRLLVKTAQVTPPQEEIGHHRRQALILGSLNHADLKFEPCWGVADARVKVTHAPTGRTGYGGSEVAAMMNLAETWDAQSV